MCLSLGNNRFLCVVFVCLLLFSTYSFVDGQQCIAPGEIATEFGVRKSDGRPLSNNSSTKRTVPSGNHNSRYIALQLEKVNVSSIGWTLTIRNKTDSRLLQTYGPSDFTNNSTLWTPRFLTDQVELKLHLESEDDETEIRIGDFIMMPEEAEHPFYSIKEENNPDYKPLYSPETREPFKPLGDSVGMLIASSGLVKKTWCCSGVFITSDHFLTNFHCGEHSQKRPESAFWTDSICEDASIDLSWDGDSISFPYNCKKVIAKDPKLDIAIIEVSKLQGSGEPRPATIRLSEIQREEDLTIVHHPLCLQKQISENTCRVEDPNFPGYESVASTSDFTHKCDTEGGSSGAPVFDTSGKVIGLHHEGFQLKEAGNCDSIDKLNKAVRFDRILDFLEENHPEILKRMKIE